MFQFGILYLVPVICLTCYLEIYPLHFMNMDHEFLYKCIQCSVFGVEIIQLAVLLIRGGTFCAPVQVQRLINVKFLPLSAEIFKPTRNYFFENSMLLILPCLVKRIIIWRRKNFEISLPKSLQKLITWSRIIKVRLRLQPNLFLPLKDKRTSCSSNN